MMRTKSLVAVFAATLMGFTIPSLADDGGHDQSRVDMIIRSLKPPSASPSPVRTIGREEIATLPDQGGELGVQDSERSVDFDEIAFDFNSARLRPESLPIIRDIAIALQDGELSSYRFIVAGHTDAVGSAEYNMELSEKRARAVVEKLYNDYGIERGRLKVLGLGETQLERPDDPESAANRRVEVRLIQ